MAEETKVVEETSEKSVKNEVEKKIQKQIEKKNEKNERLGIYRVWEYIKEEHKWESYVSLFFSLVVLILGCLMLSGTLVVKENIPVIGSIPTLFAWILVVLGAGGLLYSVYPFFKPAFPEFRKISWLTGYKFLGNTVRVFLFLIIFTLLFLLYDSFITEILALIL